ncbi:MAG: hypothetical protein JWP97_460 [Labilithrix sp.]|nr:hypothetical protein [Labilithrix sp.]
MDAPLARRLARLPFGAIGRSVAVAVVVVYALYLIGANLILRTHLLRGWVSTRPSALLVDYTSAWSFVPGKVSAEGLRLRFQDRSVQMSIAADRVSVDIDLWKLTKHEVAFDHARVEGVVYRLRSKLETLEGNEGRARAFPLIDGFPESPLEADQPAIEPRRSGSSWAVELTGIEATVRDVWTMEYRLRGETVLHGGFRVAHGSMVYVTPSSMHTKDGVLSIGEDELVRGADWSVDAQLDPFSPRMIKGAWFLRYLSFAVRQHGTIATLAPLGKAYLGPSTGTTLEEGGGTIELDLHVDHGIVQSESRVTYRTDRVVVRSGGLAITTDLEATGRVETEGGPPRVVAEAKAARGRLAPATDLQNVHAELALGGIDVVMPIGIAAITGGVGLAHTADMRVWNEIAGGAVVFEGGAISVAAKGDYRGGAFTGRVDTELDKLALKSGPFWMRASGSSATDLASKELARDLTFPNARVDLHDMDLRLLGGHSEGLWMRARSSDTRITTAGQGVADSHIAVESGPGDAATRLFTRLASLPDLAANATAGETLSATMALRIRHEDVVLDVTDVKDGALEGAARIHHAGPQPTSGAVLVKAGPLSAGVTFGRGTWSLVPLASKEWFRGAALTH